MLCPLCRSSSKSDPPRAGATQSSWFGTSSRSTRSWGHGGVFSYELLTDRPGLIIFKADGKKVELIFANESGGHRWQRVPPTEKRGRIQTSTITVAVLPIPRESELKLNDRDLDWKTCRGSGAGGQHKNVTDSAVQLTHLPTGVMVRCESERSQHINRQMALEVLRARLAASEHAKALGVRAASRRAQIGSGMRGDKRRTIRVKDGIVTDHVLGKRWSLKDYMRGNWG